MKALQGSTRAAFLGFFASHIVFTVIVDGQALAGSRYPEVLQAFLAWYVAVFNDPLMGHPSPQWFQSLVAAEYCLQLPFFFVACYYLSNNNSLTNSKLHTDDDDCYCYPARFRSACIAYGAHTATTMVPILTALATNANASDFERCIILAVYLPYLFFPLWILYIAVTDDDTTAVSKKKSKAM